VNSSSRGSRRERQVLELLRAEGWVAFRAPASLGVADVVAIRQFHFTSHRWASKVRLIEVKTTSTRGPYNDFGPDKRAALKAAAEQAGASAYLYHWPLRGELRVIPASEWPT